MRKFLRKFVKQFRYSNKGFTLIEVLVVIAILGVLAAVVVPNVSRFMGKGKDEAGLTELHNVQTSMTAMMVDQSPILTLVTVVAIANPTNDMTSFPDGTYELFGTTVRYLQKSTTQFWYSTDNVGGVRGWWTSGGSGTATNEIGVDAAP